MRILLIDDEPGVTENLNLYLQDDAHSTEVLNYVETKDELIELLESFEPEGVSLDFDMNPSGETLYTWIRTWSDKVAIVFYTKYAKSPSHRDKMMEVGARATHIVSKREAANDVSKLVRALRSR